MIHDLEYSGRYRTDVEVIKSVAEHNPQFGIKANLELSEISKLISNKLLLMSRDNQYR
jgi:hypothetical protein